MKLKSKWTFKVQVHVGDVEDQAIDQAVVVDLNLKLGVTFKLEMTFKLDFHVKLKLETLEIRLRG